MATYYVATSANGGSDGQAGTSWALAKETFAAGLALCSSAGDILYVDSTLNDTSPTGNTTLSHSGTDLSPVVIISATYNTTTYAAGAKFATSGGVYDITFSNRADSWGVSYAAGDNFLTAADSNWHFYDCTLELAGAVSSDLMQFTGVGIRYTFDNVTFKFGHASQGVELSGSVLFRMRDCTVDGTNSPTDFIKSLNAYGATVDIDGCDFSAMGSGAEIISGLPANFKAQSSRFYIANSLLRSTATAGVITAATIVSRDTPIEAYNVSTGSAVTNYYVANIYGIATDDTANYLDGDNAFSLLMDTDGDATDGHNFLRCMLGEVYFDSATDTTVGVELLTDNVQLQDDEFWIEVRYPKSGTLSHGQGANTRGGIGESGTNLSAGTATAWTSPDVTTDLNLKCEIDLSATSPASGAGVVQVWCYLAKTNAIVYVDSKIVVT